MEIIALYIPLGMSNTKQQLAMCKFFYFPTRINYQWEFDDDMAHNVFHCKVFSFDPTMNWYDGQKRGENITFFRIAMAARNGDNMSLETDIFSRGLSYKSSSPTWNWRTLRGTALKLGHEVRSLIVTSLISLHLIFVEPSN